MDSSVGAKQICSERERERERERGDEDWDEVGRY